MRRLLESLVPGQRPISWKWIGGVFAFYVMVMAVAAGLLATDRSRANLARQAGATVATGGSVPAAAETRGQVRQVQYQNNQDTAHPF